MEVRLLQMDIVWGKPAENRRRAEALLRESPGADLYVLPEMFSTGFATEPEGIAEKGSDGSCETLEWLWQMAQEMDAALTGSVAVCEEGRFFNRCYFVRPDWKMYVYDKHHLFTYSAENEYFTPGDAAVVAKWRGWRFRLAVCYDLRFPVWLRNRGDYDALICVASWPDVRRTAWDTLLRARAIENQCYVLGVNRVGKDPTCKYDGGTVLVNPFGDVLAAAGNGREEVVSGELDFGMLRSYADKFPVLKDADKFELKL